MSFALALSFVFLCKLEAVGRVIRIGAMMGIFFGGRASFKKLCVFSETRDDFILFTLIRTKNQEASVIWQINHIETTFKHNVYPHYQIMDPNSQPPVRGSICYKMKYCCRIQQSWHFWGGKGIFQELSRLICFFIPFKVETAKKQTFSYHWFIRLVFNQDQFGLGIKKVLTTSVCACSNRRAGDSWPLLGQCS